MRLTQNRVATGSPSSSVPERALPRPAPVSPITRGGSWLAAQGRLPLAFMGLGLGWFAIAAAATALWPTTLALPHVAPIVVALTHTWVLGFLVTIAVGAIYQLAPVALGTTLWSERMGWLHFVLHAAAVPVMIHAFWRWNLPLLAGAGSILFGGVALFLVNVLATVARSGKRDAVAWSLGLAAGWLAVTVIAGLTLVANRLHPFWAGDPILLLRAHAHLGIVGFFVTLLQGVTFRLIPMFTLGEVPDWRPVRVGLWASQLGLLALAPALAFHAGSVSVLAGVTIMAGLTFSGWALKQTFATRKKRVLDVGVAAFVRGAVALALSGAAGIWLVWPTSQAGSEPGGLSANVYGVLIFAGALVPTVAGMMNKIVPFLTWMRAYGPKVGRVPTPSASTLSNERLEFWAMTLQGVAILPLLIGTWTERPIWLRAGGALLAIGTGAFLLNMARILRHLWRPVSSAATPVANRNIPQTATR